MARIDDLLSEALRLLPEKPPDTASREAKKRYSELISQKVALAMADELRHRGLKEARPSGPNDLGDSGAERRMAGGLGAKKVDVTWATEQSGLLLGISIKSINFRDSKSGHYQKNLTNRRSDMLIEAVTLHRRFPYAVLAGYFFLDCGAETDGTARRHSTFANAHTLLQLFTGRNDPAGREEQFERFYLILLDASPSGVRIRPFAVGNPSAELSMSGMIDELLTLVVQRNPDFYEVLDGRLRRAGRV